MSKPLIVFDLDGTLIDSARDLADSTNDVLASYGRERLPDETIISFVGEGARRLVERALAAAGAAASLDDAFARFQDVYARRLVVHTRPYPGIVEIVARLDTRASLAVLTNKPEAPTRRLLDAFDLTRHVPWVIGGDAPFPRKPDPAGLMHLIGLAGVDPSRALMIGDSGVDAQTARRAGSRFCLARYGFGQARGATMLREDEFAADKPNDLATAIELFLIER